MDPKIIALATALVAVIAAVSSAFVPDAALAEGMRGLAAFLLGSVVVKRPGDLAATTHPDDLR